MVDASLKNEGIYSKYSGRYVQVQNQDSDETFSNGSLDFDGYLKLLVSQMSNQDFNDPMSDADLLNQMAQYSMLEGIKDMTQQTAISYAASLVGKVVTVSDGQYYHTGIVNSISVEKGKPYVMVDGQSFKSSEITDIVTMEDYVALGELLGKTVKIKGAGEDANTGVVSGIVFIGGQGYVAVNGNTYAASRVEVVETEDKEEGGENSGTEGTEGTEGSGDAAENGGVTGETDGTENNTEKTETDPHAFKVGEVEESKAASYAASSAALTDLLMRELDRVDEVKSVNAASEQHTENFDLEEIMQTAHIQVPEYAASVAADMNDYILSAVDGPVTYASGDSTVSGVGNVSIRDYDRSTGTGTLVDDNYTEVITDDVPRVTTTTYTSSTSTSQYTASGKLKGVTASAGIATTDGVPHRISVEQYPQEAALADEYGTRMYDIRHINNHEITSRIKTGPVISRTASGRGVTEIGYSGMGQLGEVVTFEDGTQRVEILLKSGKSSWLYTSGMLTLDQICTTNGAPGSLSNMTGAEKAIRHYSKANETQLRNLGLSF
ncbi:MAG: hypothetical protein K2K44_10360 [Oscillospiraceae bacterium]|nr:hypothetical protein [Oscillospiraceae bacterium]